MQGRFLRNLALVVVLNLLVKPFYILGIDAAVQERVGAAAYGTYAALLSLSFLLNILLDLGLTNHTTRRLAREPGTMAAELPGLLGVRAALVVLYAVVTLATALVLGYGGLQLHLLGWLIVNQALAALLLFLRGAVAAGQRYAQDSLLSVLDRALLIGGMAWLLWGRGPDAPLPILWFVQAQTVVYVVAVGVAWALVRRQTRVLRPRWPGRAAGDLLRRSFPYALLVLLMTFYYRTDTVMLERLLPDGPLQAGIYAQAFRFFEAFNMLGYLLAGLLLPMFSRLLGDGAPVAPLTSLAFRLVWAGTVALAVLAVLLAPEVMALRYTAHVAESAPVLAVLGVSFVAVCTTYVFGTLLTAGGDLRTLNRLAAAGMVANLALNLWLIPRHQGLGAAWASLITQSAMAIAQAVLAARRFSLPRGASAWGGPVLYAAGLAAVALGLGTVDAAPLTVLLGVPAAALLLAFATRTLRAADLRGLRAPAAGGTGSVL
ncbi:MAG: polysaccharide biosynthesis C-terminal domain-containing protein [Flavobacteriales bacterium]|nr:polysaccharide biosynthesis C-terminal domain-containing protein [Flavobacteriales bacterium]